MERGMVYPIAMIVAIAADPAGLPLRKRGDELRFDTRVALAHLPVDLRGGSHWRCAFQTPEQSLF
jgi:hypothetical protein